ncbi:hypothetical protein ACYPKM_04160 [Pseudomonas aeruginosa]
MSEEKSRTVLVLETYGRRVGRMLAEELGSKMIGITVATEESTFVDEQLGDPYRPSSRSKGEKARNKKRREWGCNRGPGW